MPGGPLSLARGGMRDGQIAVGARLVPMHSFTPPTPLFRSPASRSPSPSGSSPPRARAQRFFWRVAQRTEERKARYGAQRLLIFRNDVSAEMHGGMLWDFEVRFREV